ncbi:DUF4142 domain-containing protein [Flexithrix dorotheae]|uniref:DUF4142 domain-containing protein n=1 Tax=Flexithrix dorotheae TaxID=70993 RepID=UPI00036FC2BE|nr:DUF4142 domain-containing protein [Flexithrix dorotheae]
MLKNILIISGLCSALVFSSCNSKYKDDAQVESTEEINEAKFSHNDDKEDDAEFLVEAAGYNIMILEISEIARKKAISPRAQSLAKSMATEHQMVKDQLSSIAREKSIVLPVEYVSNEHNTKEKFMDMVPGEDFDEAYVEFIEDAHEKIKTELDDIDEINDSEIKTWAKSFISKVEMHEEMADEMEDKID